MLWLAVALGGAMGAVARYGVSVGVVTVAGTNAAAPVATLLVNVVGSGAMGAVYGFLSGGGAMPESLRLFLGVGFLGALTTFSTFSLDIIALTATRQIMLAGLYAVASLVLSLGVFLLVAALARGAG